MTSWPPPADHHQVASANTPQIYNLYFLKPSINIRLQKPRKIHVILLSRFLHCSSPIYIIQKQIASRIKHILWALLGKSHLLLFLLHKLNCLLFLWNAFPPSWKSTLHSITIDGTVPKGDWRPGESGERPLKWVSLHLTLTQLLSSLQEPRQTWIKLTSGNAQTIENAIHLLLFHKLKKIPDYIRRFASLSTVGGLFIF